MVLQLKKSNPALSKIEQLLSDDARLKANYEMIKEQYDTRWTEILDDNAVDIVDISVAYNIRTDQFEFYYDKDSNNYYETETWKRYCSLPYMTRMPSYQEFKQVIIDSYYSISKIIISSFDYEEIIYMLDKKMLTMGDLSGSGMLSNLASDAIDHMNAFDDSYPRYDPDNPIHLFEPIVGNLEYRKWFFQIASKKLDFKQMIKLCKLVDRICRTLTLHDDLLADLLYEKVKAENLVSLSDYSKFIDKTGLLNVSENQLPISKNQLPQKFTDKFTDDLLCAVLDKENKINNVQLGKVISFLEHFDNKQYIPQILKHIDLVTGLNYVKRPDGQMVLDFSQYKSVTFVAISKNFLHIVDTNQTLSKPYSRKDLKNLNLANCSISVNVKETLDDMLKNTKQGFINKFFHKQILLIEKLAELPVVK